MTPSTSNNDYAVTLPKPFVDTNYQIQKTIHGGAATNSGVEWGWMGDNFSISSSNTTTTLYLSIAGSSYCTGYYWQACGYTSTNIGKTIIKY